MTLNVHYNSKCKITIIILNRKVNSLIYIEFYQYYQFINIKYPNKFCHFLCTFNNILDTFHFNIIMYL